MLCAPPSCNGQEFNSDYSLQPSIIMYLFTYMKKTYFCHLHLGQYMRLALMNVYSNHVTPINSQSKTCLIDNKVVYFMRLQFISFVDAILLGLTSSGAENKVSQEIVRCPYPPGSQFWLLSFAWQKCKTFCTVLDLDQREAHSVRHM